MCVAAIVCGASAREPRAETSLPTQFEIGRRTFFDFGPPFNYYEVLLVRPAENGASVERITLTPPGNACTQPTKVEIVSAPVSESVAVLLGKTNPCTIPEKELRRELKRCKKCLVFSGADVAMQFKCGTQNRVIRADILDRDMFDPDPKTPRHTSWTVQLLGRLDDAVGPGVMQKPIFPLPEKEESSTRGATSPTLQDVGSGKYDVLFQGAPEKPSDLYRAAQIRPPAPSVRLLSSSPFQPEVFIQPKYPLLARLARIEGAVVFKAEVDRSKERPYTNRLKRHWISSRIAQLRGSSERSGLAEEGF